MKRIKASTLANAAIVPLKFFGITLGILLTVLFMTPTIADQALAAGHGSQQGNGKIMSGQGGQGGHGGQSTGAKGVKDAVLAEEDDDSDRPPWAGGDPTQNPHSGGGEGKPDDAGTMKGEDYGDLIVLVRDPDTGEPILLDGELQVCLDADCEVSEPMVDGEIPAGVTPIEVEFGRAAVARSPDKVSDHALDEALDKLIAGENETIELTTDEAGRITIITTTTDPVTLEQTVTSATIDSPLENLALYIDLMEGLVSDATSQAEEALGSLANMETAASLLAGVADKTGDISLDYVVYNNVITGVVASGDYYDYSTFTYTRSFPVDYVYFYMDGTEVKTATLDINAYLADSTINGTLTSDGGATLFAAAADDAVEVIELIHTQIHDAILPGTITP